mmetsp:Transcript_118770/g.378802  ORF Transcript_118770/g.378802 Transcript_118770/m.378802 type:complete len:348 (+) Transcript_118770:104-1147(+)
MMSPREDSSKMFREQQQQQQQQQQLWWRRRRRLWSSSTPSRTKKLACPGSGASVSTYAPSDGSMTPKVPQVDRIPLLPSGQCTERGCSTDVPFSVGGDSCGWPADFSDFSPAGVTPSSSSASPSRVVGLPPGLAPMVLDAGESDGDCGESRAFEDPLSDLNAFLDALRNSSGGEEGSYVGALSGHASFLGLPHVPEDGALSDDPLLALLVTSSDAYCPGELLAKTLPFAWGCGRASSSSSGDQEVSVTKPLSAFGGPEALSALEDFQAGPPGEFPTEGSKGHQFRVCKPCAFVNTKGCKDGVECKFCHLCGPGEKKRRKKERTTFWRNLNGNIISGWQGQPQSDTAR